MQKVIILIFKSFKIIRYEYWSDWYTANKYNNTINPAHFYSNMFLKRWINASWGEYYPAIGKKVES